LLKWLREPVTRDQLLSNPKMPLLRFSLAAKRLAQREVLSYLEGFKQAVVEYLDELRGHLKSEPALPLYPRLSLEHGIEAFRAQLRWVERAQKQVREARQVGSPESRRQRARSGG
jgi:hypothetical protein